MWEIRKKRGTEEEGKEVSDCELQSREQTQTTNRLQEIHRNNLRSTRSPPEEYSPCTSSSVKVSVRNSVWDIRQL